MLKLSGGVVLAGVLLLSGGPAWAEGKADLKRAEEIVAGRCFLCHGMEGESSSPLFPRLAGSTPSTWPSSWRISSRASAGATP